MKKILLTFDYELFLKNSGTLEKCILEPTNKLIKLFNELDIKAVFFVDILYLERLINQKLDDQVQLLEKNLHNLLKHGHQIELHIHSHWIDAVYEEEAETWDLSNDSKYRLHSLDSSTLNNIFENAYNLLTSTCKKFDNSYSITSFRAGGLCIQPFDIIKPLFNKFKIKIDSSVAPGLTSKSTTHYYNFIDAPKKDLYQFNDDPIKPSKNGTFWEIPINIYKKNFFHKMRNKLFSSTLSDQPIFGDGTPASPRSSSSKKINFSKFKSDTYLFSLDGNVDFKVLENGIKKSNHEFITIISHPKLLTNNSFKIIRNLSKKGYKFITIKDLNLN